MKQLAIPPEILNAIHTAALAGYPHETCGLLVGEPLDGIIRVHEEIGAANLNRERPRDRYELDPMAMFRAERGARDKGLEVVGVWHSHPDHPAEPSATDRAQAWKGWSYLIVSVARGRVTELRSWRLEKGRFVEEGIMS